MEEQLKTLKFQMEDMLFFFRDKTSDENIMSLGLGAPYQSNVGIGTSTPTFRLEVSGDMSVNNTLFVHENGTVGIGTGSPVAGLTVSTYPSGVGVSEGVVYINPPGTSTAATAEWTYKATWNSPNIGDGAKAAEFGDLDGDGDLDMLVGTYSGTVIGYTNIGTTASPNWLRNASWDTAKINYYGAPALADLDGDGDLDLLHGDYYGDTYAYENTGSATSVTWARKAAWDLPNNGNYAYPTLADLDNDGDYDVLKGTQSGITYAYENTGSVSSPTWTYKGSWDISDQGDYSRPKFGDMDGDGDYDIIMGEQTGGVILGFENTGTISAPVWSAKSAWDLSISPKIGLGLGDLDGDGDLDLFVGGETDNYVYAYENTGSLGSITNTLFGVAVDGSEKMRINGQGAIFSSGYVDIENYGDFAYSGTSAAMTIRQNGAGKVLDVKDGSTTVFTVLDGGNVGINTTSPTQLLDVRGNINVSGDIYTYGADFAEMMNSNESLEPGDVVCFAGGYQVRKCSQRSEGAVMGVVSTDETIAGNWENAGSGYPIGIVGIVPTKIVGPIKIGDILTTSSVEGFAEKASIEDFGAIIGKAMDNCEENICKINVLVGLK